MHVWRGRRRKRSEKEERRRGGGRRVGGEEEGEDKEKEWMEHDFVRLSNDKEMPTRMDAYIALLNR